MKELHGTASQHVGVPIERCYELLIDVEDYPRWHPDVVQSAEVIERRPDGSPARARAKLHVGIGPLVKDFNLTLMVQLARPASVTLTRVPHDASDAEQFQVTWTLSAAGGGTGIGLALAANLSVPRLVPLGGVGDSLAAGFVSAAAREASRNP
jgi:ribosome-associated toxin RatA of RatAB toxin-antitoxin module